MIKKLTTRLRAVFYDSRTVATGSAARRRAMGNPIARAGRRHAGNWLPAVAWAALIYAFSTGAFSGPNTSRFLVPLLNHFFPALSGGDIALIHMLIRKLGHVSEYLILALLVLRALSRETGGKLSPRRLALGLLITALYAVSDELHQAFVPGRTASIADVSIDVLGGVCGALWFQLRKRGKKAP
jgi:VanZ family protein